jgi:hypothetical protein
MNIRGVRQYFDPFNPTHTHGAETEIVGTKGEEIEYIALFHIQ